MANFKRKRPNPKHDTYGGWTVESKTHQDMRQPQVHDNTVVNHVNRNSRQRLIDHKEPDERDK